MLRRLRHAVTLGLVVAMVAACGGANSNTSGASVNNKAVFRYAVQNAINSLDPQVATTSYAAEWYGPALENLLRESLDGTYSPWLATAWTMSADFTSMTLTLKTGVKFQDGTPFNAQAVKADFDRAKTIKGSSVTTLNRILASTEPVNDSTVKLNFTAPTSQTTVLEALANKGTEMISPAAFNNADFAMNPVGTGAFKLTSYQVGVKAVYDRWSGYWGKAPAVARVEITTVTDNNVALNALKSGQFDMIALDPVNIPQVNATKGLRSASFPSPQVNGVLINIDGVFSDIRVRQALSYATDRKALADFIGGGSQPTEQLAKQGSKAYDPSIENTYAYDVAKAKSLLADAGYANGAKFTLNFTARPAQQDQAQVLQQMWAKGGFTVTLQATEGATTVQKCLAQKKCDALLGYQNLSLDFLSNFVAYGAKGGFSMSNSVDPVLLQAVTQARTTLQPDQQATAVRHLNDVLTQELSQTIPLNTITYLLAVSNKVQSGFEYRVSQCPYYDTVVMTT